MLRWLKALTEAPLKAPSDQPALPDFKALRVIGRAMCCSLGHTAPAASAALNARINHFQESRFVGQGGRRVVVAMLHGLDTWGMDRMALMLNAVITEALGAEPTSAACGTTALVVCCAEGERPGMDSASFQQGVNAIVQPWGFHASSLALDCGKGGIAQALHRASALLQTARATGNGPLRVLLVGLDSLLLAATIEQLIGMDRLLTDSNSDGLIPGEGAAALLLELAAPQPTRSAALSPSHGLHIMAAASAMDDWRLDGDTPARAQGLTQAVRTALKAAGTSMSELDFHVSGFNGEAWCAREITLMQSRCMASRRSHYAHLAPCQWLGDTGAASPVLALAWLADLMGRDPGVSPGQSALAHFAGDDGRRSALVLHHPTASAEKLAAKAASPSTPTL
jgi:3-oxoacyl-[acyl-carrier-protein] synthase I